MAYSEYGNKGAWLILKIPLFSIPFIDEIDRYDIGFWVWMKPESNGHYVFIERRDGIYIAGADNAGERLIVGVWRETPKNPLGILLDYGGKFAANMNPDLTDEEVTERIWDFLQGQALTMKLSIARGKN